MTTLEQIIAIIFVITLIYFGFLSFWYLTLAIAAFPDVIRTYKESKYGNVVALINKNGQLPITIVTPAFNEGKRILNMIYSVLNSDYKNTNLIIVNDGSTDNMMEILTKELELYEIPYVVDQKIKTFEVKRCFQSARYPQITVLDKEHSTYNCGADAINAGINACKTPIVLTVDADTILEPEALSRLLFSFLANDHCIAVSGSIYVLNGKKVTHGKLTNEYKHQGMVTNAQYIEYMNSFLFARSGINIFGGAMCYPGAFSFFETEILRDVGGFDTANYAYDAEIIIRLHHWMRKKRYPYTMVHTPSAFCWTEVPSTLTSYLRQRDKWQRGMLRGIFRYIGMFLNPRYGLVGMLTFPTYVLFEVFAPIIECITYVSFIICMILGQVALAPFLWLMLLAWGVSTMLTIIMIILDLVSFNKYKKSTDMLWALGVVLFEMTGFRQIRVFRCTLSSISFFIRRLRGLPL